MMMNGITMMINCRLEWRLEKCLHLHLHEKSLFSPYNYSLCIRIPANALDMDKAYIRSVYRRLYRAGQAAVRHRAPKKYLMRQQIRLAFRNGTTMPTSLEIDNTVAFLRTAGHRRGIENNIVSTMMNMAWNRNYGLKMMYSPLSLEIVKCAVRLTT